MQEIELIIKLIDRKMYNAEFVRGWFRVEQVPGKWRSEAARHTAMLEYVYSAMQGTKTLHECTVETVAYVVQERLKGYGKEFVGVCLAPSTELLKEAGDL